MKKEAGQASGRSFQLNQSHGQSVAARVTRHGGGETQGHAQQSAGALRDMDMDGPVHVVMRSPPDYRTVHSARVSSVRMSSVPAVTKIANT